MKLEALQPDAAVRGILPDAVVTVVSAEWHGSDTLTLVYRGPNGRVADEILYRHDRPRLAIVEAGRPWSFENDLAIARLERYFPLPRFWRMIRIEPCSALPGLTRLRP